VSFACVVYVQ